MHFEFNYLLHELMQSLDLLQKHGYLSESGMAEKDSFCLQL